MANESERISAALARESLKRQAKRLGVGVDRLARIALWNLVAELEGANLEDAREIACLDEETT